ncbi:lamin tail domain-containing protein [Nonomuraea fuscirosea]|uniref:lamin tail domain-containing protein n=1 Tax=Nonomuraea fuscirosea TaxID=1291556 RepID=UPI003445C32E
MVRLVPTAVATLVAMATLGAAPAQAAAPRLKIAEIFYDSPGADSRSTGSLNAEYVTLLNTTKRTLKLKGWSVRDKTGSTYTFMTGVVLKARKRITLRSGRGTDGRGPGGRIVHWNRDRYVWNNDQDTAYVRDPKGRLVDSCSYKASTGSASVSC